MMFWSKTKDVVHDFTEKRDCFLTLEDTLLGSVLDGLTWCGKEGSSGTTLHAIDNLITGSSLVQFSSLFTKQIKRKDAERRVAAVI